jgi:hypothetical protein
LDPAPDRPTSESSREQLPPGDHSMLALGEPRQQPIGVSHPNVLLAWFTFGPCQGLNADLIPLGLVAVLPDHAVSVAGSNSRVAR